MTELRTELERFQRDIDYFEAHQQELLHQYPDAWVAIFNEQIVGKHTEFEQLLTDLEERGIPIEKVLVRHLTTREELLILAL